MNCMNCNIGTALFTKILCQLRTSHFVKAEALFSRLPVKLRTYISAAIVLEQNHSPAVLMKVYLFTSFVDHDQ